jgi:hypothetical protein
MSTIDSSDHLIVSDLWSDSPQKTDFLCRSMTTTYRLALKGVVVIE